MRNRNNSVLGPILVVSWAAAAGCGGEGAEEPIARVDAEVVYGNDDRVDPFDYADPVWAARAEEFSVALVDTSQVDMSDPNDVSLGSWTLEERLNVCSDERFASQPALSSCSGTLIDDDIVVTAGHCINSCNDSKFVFDYTMTSPSTLGTITSDDVYSCVRILARTQHSTGLDYAVVQLDRPVVGRTPAPVRVADTALPIGTDLVVAGYPSRLPLKLADGATLRSNDLDLRYFVANLDTFVGNSGSGVFDQSTGEFVGILVRGAQDYVADGDCNRVNVCPDDGCRGEDAVYAFHALRGACERTDASFCSCGDGACGPLEDPTSCAADCSCGDGVCSNGESATSCPADCQFEVLYQDHAPQPNFMTPGLQVRNTSANMAFIGRAVLRYYFTQEPAGTLAASCWGCSTMPDVTFHEIPGGGCAEATHYMDVRLPNSLWLSGGDTSEQLRLAVNASSWQPFDHTNDHSHGSGNWVENPNVTMYLFGARVAGDEPCPGIFIEPPTN
ncbi:MAG: trypsin-like peptidase domain-containing protein [Myxococcales bacterium]|nr:trypsin-like peptidase domain-containing protein [Myxococcales bacterium]